MKNINFAQWAAIAHRAVARGVAPALLITNGLLLCRPAQAQVTLSHLSAYDVDAMGQHRGTQAWDASLYHGPNKGYDIFIIGGSNLYDTILNANSREPNLTLYNGTYSFTLLLAPGKFTTDGGLSLYFDDKRGPQISAFARMGSRSMTPTEQPKGGNIWDPYIFGDPEHIYPDPKLTDQNGQPIPLCPVTDDWPYVPAVSRGTLVYRAYNGTTATLTGLRFFEAHVDRVGPSRVGATGHDDLGIFLTITVTGAPH